MAESYQHYLKIYYSDGHNEISNKEISNYLKKRRVVKGYKNPITIDSTDLFPTTNIRYEQCCWVNLDYLEDGNHVFINLLEHKGILAKVKKMYLRYKRQQITVL